MKKLLSLTTALIMIATTLLAVPLTAQAKQSYHYNLLNDGTIEITEYVGSASYPNVPSSIDGHKVTSIGDEAFCGTEVKGVTLPDSITKIGDSVFNSCEDLKTVTLPKNLKSLGAGTFTWCKKLKSVSIPDCTELDAEGTFSGCWNIESIKLPKKLKKVGDCMFFHCESLKTLEIPSGVTSIGDYAFMACGELKSVNIPSGVTKIGVQAFRWCSKLESISIPKATKKLCAGAFMGCQSVKNIKVDAKNKYYCEKDGVVYTKDNKTLFAYSGGKTDKSFTVPSTVTKLEQYSFVGSEKLEKLTIPNNVKTIGEGAFCYCTKLSDIKLPSKIKLIDYWTFEGCESLESISIPKSVKTIRGNAFWGCTGLKRIVIPDSVKEIEEYAIGYHDYFDYELNVYRSCEKIEGITICAPKGSAAQKYAKENKLDFATKEIILSDYTYIYDGNAKKPTVTVKDINGKTISTSNYKITYPKNTKDVGKYSVKVTFNGKYSGKETAYFVINPKPTTISSLKAESKGFEIKWEKQTKQTTGYQIQYARDREFTYDVRSTTVSKNSSDSKSINKLSANKKYYVRVRTYKTVSGKTYYSDWSSIKTVTTK